MNRVTKKRIWKGNRKDLLFYILMMAFPVAQFCIFYVGVNANSILLAFQKIDLAAGTTVWTGANFANAFKLMTAGDGLLSMAWMSLLSYVILLGIGTQL